MGDKYEAKYRWIRTRIDANDPPTDFDWTGYDGEEEVGRIRKDLHGPTKGKWQWAGRFPRSFQGSPPKPNTGYVATARIAVKLCEDFWERACGKSE